jgi:single-strand DNA-binding protein
MASLNKVYLMGNLTRDPDVRTTTTGLKIAKLGLAVNRKYRTRENELKDETTFVDIDAFGQQAEVLERYCQKGSPLFVEGRLRLDQWQSNTGENRSKLTVVLENFQFIGGREGGQAQEDSGAHHAEAHPENKTPNTPPSDNSIQDDDIPF